MPNFFISAIDTGVGKSVVTGLLARYLRKQGKSVITFKPAQTGCSGIADDILMHRKLAGMELMPEDKNGKSCPYVFPVPASPHLAAEMAGTIIDVDLLDNNLAELSKEYEYVLVEGAGGLMVPLTPDVLFVDWAAKLDLPLILVCSARLGSINHTLLSIECARSRGMKIVGIIYNLFPSEEPHITTDSLKIISQHSPAPVIEIPEIIGNEIPEIDFSCILDGAL